MGSTVSFSRADLLELRRLRDRAAAAARLPDLHPWGWSTSLLDVSTVLEPFGMFRLRTGHQLRAAHYRGPEGTGAVVWALPDDAPPIDVAAWPDDCTPLQPPPPPAGALGDVMDAVEGERTPWHLLCASILQREVHELGGTAGYRKWGKHDLISENPWRHLTAVQAQQNRRHFTEGQYWMEEMLTDLHPRVEEDGRRTRVVFYSVHRRYHLPVYVHEDRFGEDGFSLVPGRRLVGRVPYQKPAWAGDVDDPAL